MLPFAASKPREALLARPPAGFPPRGNGAVGSALHSLILATPIRFRTLKTRRTDPRRGRPPVFRGKMGARCAAAAPLGEAFRPAVRLHWECIVLIWAAPIRSDRGKPAGAGNPCRREQARKQIRGAHGAVRTAARSRSFLRGPRRRIDTVNSGSPPSR
jgi:hypothetical protein